MSDQNRGGADFANSAASGIRRLVVKTPRGGGGQKKMRIIRIDYYKAHLEPQKNTKNTTKQQPGWSGKTPGGGRANFPEFQKHTI